MANAAALLKKICANPNDLKARSAYADALIAARDPRGTFIAEQIQLGEMSGLEEDYPLLLANSMRTLREHGARWLAPIFKSTPIDPEEYTRMEHGPLQNAQFENGFLQRIAVRPADAAKHWKKLADIEPLVGLELVVYEDIDSSLGDTEFPQRCQSLKVTPNGWLTAQALGVPLGWGLESLVELDLSGCDLGQDGAKLLANEPTDLGAHFEDWVDPPPLNHKQLQSLVLKNTNILDEGLQLLLSKGDFQELQRLDVSQCKLGDEDSLTAITKLSSLNDLSIAGNNGMPLTPLIGSNTLDSLQRLSLPQTVEPAELQAMFPQPSRCLRTLEVASAKTLLAQPTAVANAAENLLELNIGTTRIGDKGFAELLGAPAIKSLLMLKANGCSLSDKALASITHQMSRLVVLDLASNKLTDKSLAALAEWEGLIGLAHLRLGNNRKLSKEGYETLAAASDFHPATLDIGACKDPDAVALLSERFGSAVQTKA